MAFRLKCTLLFSSCLLVSQLVLAQTNDAFDRQLAEYHANLNQLRKAHPNSRDMPDLRFFFFGMGDRRKLIYRNGVLKDALTAEVVRSWPVKRERIIPSAYTVALETTGGKTIILAEDQAGVWLTEGKAARTALTRSNLVLPDFKGKTYAPILKVLHHEVLININQGKPVPNFLVYKKPWYRDATLMGMVLKQTGNLRQIRDWVMAIRDPFDRNNHGISEADNPGELLYLISLVSNKNHPAVATVLDSLKQFVKTGEQGPYIEGKTDYNVHPVFQTKWTKFGLNALGLPDPYQIPKTYDQYSSLFWWAYKEQHVDGKRFDQSNSTNYPYLVWADDHFYGEKNGIVTNRDYPLSWEAHASDATYPGIAILDESLIRDKLSPSHTWHAAEMFLLLIEQ
ncbi:hypothetical protein J2I47_05820 [Fibrella sp. HMF5335]|uniref:Uncharacterized protein n=2 Tax=Fibrella rubiginis TaxID=2817060 RepID=A0A939GE11_9BACT|nr:hypothetical protein [Fibrella rubiginis]